MYAALNADQMRSFSKESWRPSWEGPLTTTLVCAYPAENDASGDKAYNIFADEFKLSKSVPWLT